MKNATITKPLRFLEDHIAVILGLFFPVWFGIFLAFVGVLDLLPKEVARKAEPQPMDIAFVTMAFLVVCAIIAILRLVRDVRDRKPKQIFLYMFLIALDLIFMSLFFVWFTSLQLKQDTANITSNLSLISKRLYAYQEEHGGYPPQQELESLLETLGIQESDFYRTYYFNIHSAEYHAPAEDSNDPEYRLVTLRAKDHLRFVRRDGSVGCEYLKNTHAGAAK